MGLGRAAAAGLALVFVVHAGAEVEGPWRELDRDGSFVVEARPTEDGSIWMRGHTEMSQPAAAIRAVLLDLPAFPEWVSRLGAWDVLERGPGEAIVYGRHDFPWPIADRDYVVRYTWTDEGQKPFRLDAQAIRDPAIAAIDGVVRLTELETRWEVDRLTSGASRVAYTYRGSLGGFAGAIGRLTRGAQLRESFERLTARVEEMRPER